MFLDDKIVQIVTEWTHSESTHRIDSLALIKEIVYVCSEEMIKDLENYDPRISEETAIRSSFLRVCRSYDNAVDKLNKSGIYFLGKGAMYDFLLKTIPELNTIHGITDRKVS